jgi:hypothetical protein
MWIKAECPRLVRKSTRLVGAVQVAGFALNQSLTSVSGDNVIFYCIVTVICVANCMFPELAMTLTV